MSGESYLMFKAESTGKSDRKLTGPVDWTLNSEALGYTLPVGRKLKTKILV
jgi:hypothetical protein